MAQQQRKRGRKQHNQAKKYLKDIDRVASSIPFGEVTLTIKRHNNQTVGVLSQGTDQVNFETTKEAVEQLALMFGRLEEQGLSVVIHFSVEVKNGMIKTIGYHSIKETSYKEEQNAQENTQK